MIGLRMSTDLSDLSTMDEEKMAKMLKLKFYCYIAYLMISIYWSSFFNSRILKENGLEKYKEEDF
jgi:hypothetical protein